MGNYVFELPKWFTRSIIILIGLLMPVNGTVISHFNKR